MPLSYSTAIQNQIAYRLVGRTYAELRPAQQAAIDSSWSSGALAGGHAFEAMTLINRYANFVQVDLTAAPDDWLSWFIWEVVWRASHQVETERSASAKHHRDDAMRLAITTHTRSGHEESSSTEGWVVNHAGIRAAVLDECVRLDPPYLPTPEMVDRAARARFVMLWGYANWLWRRKSVVLTIDTGGDVTPDPSVTIDAVASDRFFYTDSSGAGVDLVHVSASDMSRLLSYGYDAGRPRFFRMTKTAGVIVWQFDRTPDVDYTVRGEVIIGLPALASASNFNDALALVPGEMLNLLQSAIVADVVSKGMDPSRGRLHREQADEQ